MTNPVWAWIVEQGLYAYTANRLFDGPPSEEAGPSWSASRYGQTTTDLPDGRMISVGGEHEDYYDADFYIYNDVWVRDAAGRVEILGYPEDVFPPTDFHTATLVGRRIVLVGGLSYPALRGDEAQVLSLDIDTYRIERVETSGAGPGWIYKHVSDLEPDGSGLIVRGGTVRRPTGLYAENIDDWRLDLRKRRWQRLTDRGWPRFVFSRADGEANHLWETNYLAYDLAQAAGQGARAEQCAMRARDSATRLRGELGREPRPDLIGGLYSPPVEHEPQDEREGERRTHRILMDGVTVRYVEDRYDVCLTIEGRLPAEMIRRLRRDLRSKLEAIENARIRCVRIV